MSHGGEPIVSNSWRKGLFDGKVVFCTGATSGGICAGQVRALVYLGANPFIVGRNAEKSAKAAEDIAKARPGSKVIGLGPVDVRKLSEMKDAVDRCVAELGGIDFVIAGAAGNFLSSFEKLSENAFSTVIGIDLIGSFNTAKAALPHLLESASKSSKGAGPGGRIIFVSATAYYTGVQLNAHAGAAKAGVDSLASILAIELGPKGVTSNVIAPGPIAGTEGVRKLLKDKDNLLQPDIPLGRIGKMKEPADATVYLFADTGDYVNGHVLVVDGGGWRTGGGQIGKGVPYPEFLLSGKDLPRL